MGRSEEDGLESAVINVFFGDVARSLIGIASAWEEDANEKLFTGDRDEPMEETLSATAAMIPSIDDDLSQFWSGMVKFLQVRGWFKRCLRTNQKQLFPMRHEMSLNKIDDSVVEQSGRQNHPSNTRPLNIRNKIELKFRVITTTDATHRVHLFTASTLHRLCLKMNYGLLENANGIKNIKCF